MNENGTLTVGDLKKFIEDIPDNTDITVCYEGAARGPLVEVGLTQQDRPFEPDTVLELVTW